MILPSAAMFDFRGSRSYPDLPTNLKPWTFAPPEVSDVGAAVSELCLVQPYGLSMEQVIALANFAYWNMSADDDMTTSVMNEFFGQESEMGRPEVTVMDLKEYPFGAASKFEFPGANLTVFSIRGSVQSLDWALNAQLFISSLFHTLAFPLALVSSPLTPFCDMVVRKLLSTPIWLTGGANLIDRYHTSIQDWIADNPPPDNDTVLYVGHSLGGGLAKLFAYEANSPVISVSGPGIEVLMTAFDVNDEVTTTDRVIAAQAELIPDNDVVPRIEASTGVKYRVLCNQGIIKCHQVTRTLCMTGIMCGRVHENFCKANVKNWDDMKKFAEGGR
jgi:lipase ATG15